MSYFVKFFELYTPENYHSELIARAIQIIAKHGKEGLEILKTQTPRLFDFIETIFILDV